MISLLDPDAPDAPFPPVVEAETEPDGLLAVGGDLSPTRLLNAYRQGIFPWYSPGQPILWWSPDPRMVLYPEHLHVSRSLAKFMRKDLLRVTFDRAFSRVIRGCAHTPRNGEGTWLTEEMITAYENLHRMRMAHSVEAWEDGELVGGLYGVHLGGAFFGESMFSRRSNASKVAFVTLVRALQQQGFQFIDCQVYTRHLHSLGAKLIPREQFIRELDSAISQSMPFPSCPG